MHLWQQKKKAGTYGDMWGDLGELWNFKRHAANREQRPQSWVFLLKSLI